MINPDLKNFYFSALESAMLEKMQVKGIDYGRMKSILFILSEKKKAMRAYFEKKVFNKDTDELPLTIEEVKSFTDSIGWNAEEAMSKMKMILVKMDFEKQVIFKDETDKQGKTTSIEL